MGEHSVERGNIKSDNSSNFNGNINSSINGSGTTENMDQSAINDMHDGIHEEASKGIPREIPGQISKKIPEATSENAGKDRHITAKQALDMAKVVHGAGGNMLVMDCYTMNYKLRMLEANKIKGLLPLKITENDGIKKLCYDITSKEAFGSFGSIKMLKMTDVRNLLISINHIIENIERYLLVPDDLVLSKDYIYVCGKNMELQLCYMPGYGADFTSELSDLLQEVLGMVDHNDHDAVVLAYSLYQESLRPGFVMADLIRILNDEHTPAKDSRDKENQAAKEVNENSGNSVNREKTTDELFVEYQMPPRRQDKNTGIKDPEAMFNAVNKPGRHRRAIIFSR